jgi:hypothetical protein
MQKGEMGFSRLLGISAMLSSALGAAWMFMKKQTLIEKLAPDRKTMKTLKKRAKKARKSAMKKGGVLVAAIAGGTKLGQDVVPTVGQAAARVQSTVAEQIGAASDVIGKYATAETARELAGTVRTAAMQPLSGLGKISVPAIPESITGAPGRLMETGAGLLGTAVGGGTAVKSTAGMIGSGAAQLERKTAKAVKAGSEEAAAATGNFFGFLFWMVILAILLIFVFIPDKETRSKVWLYFRDTSLSLFRAGIGMLRR